MAAAAKGPMPSRPLKAVLRRFFELLLLLHHYHTITSTTYNITAQRTYKQPSSMPMTAQRLLYYDILMRHLEQLTIQNVRRHQYGDRVRLLLPTQRLAVPRLPNAGLRRALDPLGRRKCLVSGRQL
jgi:hypothetical protein